MRRENPGDTVAMNNAPTAQAPELTAEQSREIANALLRQKLEVAQDIKGYRADIDDVLRQTEGMHGVQQDVKEVANNIDEHGLTAHGDIRVEDMENGTNGVNYGLSENAAIARHQLDPDQLREKPEETAETASHERSEEDGHAGQNAIKDVVIDEKGEAKKIEEQLEGEVEANQALKFRGSADAARDNQPPEVYGTGQKFIANHHDAARAYIRKDGEHAGDAVRFQAEVLKKSHLTPEQMQQKLQQETAFNHGQILQIVMSAKAEELAKNAKAPQLSMAA